MGYGDEGYGEVVWYSMGVHTMWYMVINVGLDGVGYIQCEVW